MIKAIPVVMFALASLFSAFVALAAPTQQDAQAIVDKAALFAEENGADKLIAAVNKKDGPFNQGELYVFVYDKTGTLLADPVNQALVGQNNVSKPDSDGKLFRKEIVDLANTQGTGWVKYRFANPATGKVEPKASYVRKKGDIIIIAGIYLN